MPLSRAGALKAPRQTWTDCYDNGSQVLVADRSQVHRARMHRTTPLAGLLTAIVLLASLPSPSAPVRAEGSSVTALAPLPPVATSDDRFGMVQGIQAPDLAFQAGARWD